MMFVNSNRWLRGKGQEAGKVCGCVFGCEKRFDGRLRKAKTKPKYETVSLLETAKRQRSIVVSSILTLTHLPSVRVYLED